MLGRTVSGRTNRFHLTRFDPKYLWAYVPNVSDRNVFYQKTLGTASSSLTGWRQRSRRSHRRRERAASLAALALDLLGAGDAVGNRCWAKKSTNTLTLGARYRLLGRKARNIPE